MIGNKMHGLAEKLFPINRSITGDGVRKTLSILNEYVKDLVVFEVPTGTQALDWIVPKEWSILNGYILTGISRFAGALVFLLVDLPAFVIANLIQTYIAFNGYYKNKKAEMDKKNELFSIKQLFN